MAKTKAQEALEKLNKKYGISQPKSLPGNNSNKGKQSISASPIRNNREENKKAEKSSSTKSGGANTSKTTTPKSTVNFPSAINLGLGPISKQKVASLIGSGDVKVDNNGSLKWAKEPEKVPQKTTIKSDLSDDERKARIKEIDTELKHLTIQLGGYGRAKAYGTNKTMEDAEQNVKDRISQLSQEKKTLERVGTFTASEMKQFEIDDAKARKNALPSFSATARVSPSQVNAYKEALNAHREIDKEINLLERDKAQYKELERLEELNAHTKAVTSKKDFAQGSKYTPTKPKTPEQLKAEGYKQAKDGSWYKNNLFGGTFYSGEDSDIYVYINDASKRSTIAANKIKESAKASTAFGGGVPSAGTDTYAMLGYHTLTEDEIGAFNYLYHQDRENGTNKAMEYLNKISPLLQKRAMKEEALHYKDISKEAPVVMSALSLGTNLQNAVMFPAKAVATATGVYDDMPLLDMYGNRTTAIRGGVSEDMGNWGKLGYNAAMSIGDMGVAMLAGGGNAKAIQAIMSSSAGSSTLSEAKNNGASDAKALVLGLGSAAIEWATEKYSVEAILKKPETIRGFLVTNIFTEATEEGASNISNLALDAVVSEILGERNSIEQRVDYLVLHEGRTEEEALNVAVTEQLKSLGEDVLVGGLTGGVMAGGRVAPMAVQNGIENAQRNRNYVNSFIKDEKALKSLLDESKASGEGTNSYRIAEEIEKASAEGDVTKSQIKKLIKSNNKQFKAEAKNNTEEITPEQPKTTNTLDNLPLKERLAYVSEVRNVLGNEFQWVNDVEKGTLKDSDTNYKTTPTEADVKQFRELESKLIKTGDTKVLDELSAKSEEITGNPITKSVRNRIETMFEANNPLKEIKKATGFGNEGARLTATLMESEGMSFEQAESAVKSAYNAGYTNVERSKAPTTESVSKKSSMPLRERLEYLSRNNEPITEADVKKVTGFDNEGAKVVTKYANQDGATFNRVVTEVKGAYISGRSHPDVPISNMASELTTPAQADAYSAGQIDRRLQDLSAKTQAQKAVINKESGFIAKNLPSDVTTKQVEILKQIDEALGVKSYVTEGLKGNAELNKATGEILIDKDFERAIGSDYNKEKVTVVYHALHESLHRVVELAPEEGKAFVYAMYNHLAGNEPSNFNLADQKRNAYAKQGVDISLAKAMEEVSANNILYLYGKDEGKVQRAIDSIVNGTDTKAKQGLRKFVDGLKKIIRKLKEILSGKTASERAEIQAEIDEMTMLRDMFETAFKKAVENKKALETKSNSTQNAETQANVADNENVVFSLKNKNLTINSSISYVVLEDYNNVTKGNYTELNSLVAKVENITKGTYKNKATEYSASITTETIDKAIRPTHKKFNRFNDSYIRNLNAMLKLSELFENAVYVDSKNPQKAKNKNKAIKDYHHFVAPLFMDNVEYRALITAREKIKSNTLYVLKVEVLPTQKRHTPVATQQNNAGGSQLLSVPFDISIAELVNGVKIYNYDTQITDTYTSNDIQFSLKDNDYMQAVENGDTETARRMVGEAAEKAFPNSKLRGSDGKLRIVYHGTNTGEFTVFNPDYIGMSSGDDGFFGRGFYFAYTKSEASYYGAERIIPAYLNLQNPFNFKKELQTYKGKQANTGYAPDAVGFMRFADLFPDIAKNITVGVLEKGSDTFKNLPLSEFSKAFKDVIDNKKFEYQEVTNDYGNKETLVLADEKIHEYEYDGKKHKYKDYDFQQRFYGKPNELDVAYEYLSRCVYSRVDMYSRTRLILDYNREFTEALKAMGYDGVIQSEEGDEAVAFSSEQIKSAEPVTYDDNGNVIPLSERFNTENEDIRYSLKDSEGNTLTEAQQEYFKDSKVRDEDGNLLVVYHGSPAKFTVFDHSHINAHGNSHGRGFYFTEKKSLAEGFEKDGGQLLEGYLNITNPLSEDKVTIKKTDLLKLIKATCKEEAQRLVDDDGYESINDALPDTWISNYVDTYSTNLNVAYREVTDGIYSNNDNDVEIVAEITNGGAGTENTLRLVHEILGYDGVIYTAYDGTHEFVSLVSNQFKDIKNTKPSSDSDINFSLKGTDLDTKGHKELVDIINHLQGEFEVTKFAKTDPKKLTQMTKSILKEYDSKADFGEVYQDIDDLYTYIANGEGENPAAWNDVYNRAYNISQKIVENALVKDDYMYREYESLRKHLRNTPMKFDAEYDSVPSSYGSFNEFRKANMGRLKFTNDGMSIDAVYQELSSLYPEFFNEEEQSNTADQLEQMLNVLDEIQPTEINPFDSQIEQVSTYLANDLISRFFDLPQAKPTFADKAERRVINERIKGNKKVEAVRLQKDEKIKKILEKQKEKTKKQLDKLRQQRNDKVEKEKQKRRDAVSKMNETQKTKVLRARIMRHTSDLSKKLINPTDNQHIPSELQGAVAKLLECINLESNYTYDMGSHSYKKNDDGLPTRRTQAFNELKKIYADMASSVVVDPDLLGENGWLSDVISLADKRIADMNLSELDTVWQTIRAIEASISTANKIFAEGKFATVLEFAEALRDDNAGKKEKTELKGVLGKGKKLASLDMLTPETYLHYLGDAGDSVFRMMRDAQDKHISIMKEIADFIHKELKGVNVNKLENTIHTVKLGGEDVKLSTAQLMELYVLMNREQAVEHILIGGILPDVTKSKGIKLITKTKPTKNITVGEISTAIATLTDEQKKIADKLQKYVSTTLSAYGNEASMQVYNYEKFLEEKYWTIRTNKQEISTEVGKDTTVTSVANKGMAKGTKPHANTSVRIGSIFDTFSAHASDMATYAAWLGTSEDVNRIRNFVFWEDGARTGTVKSILDTVHGLHGSDYLQKLLTDIAIGVKGTDNMNPFDKLIGNYKAASVGANIRVIIQQPTAILRAMDMIGAHYLAEGAVRPLKGWEKAKKYAPIAQWKDWGHFDINTGRQMKDVLFDNASLLEKTKQVGMWGASLADSLAWGQLWNAVEAETKAKYKDLEVKSEKYYETVAKRFTEIVDHTQVVDGILQRSQIMRSPDSLTKMATSFMGEPTKQYNMMISALNDVTKGKPGTRKKAVGRLGKTAVALAVSGIVNACAQSIIDALRDDDKEKDYWEKWLVAFIGDGEDTKLINSNVGDTFNPLGYVPFAKDIMSIMQGYDVKRMDAETITKTVNAATNMYKAITGNGKYTIAEASAQLFAEIGRLYGLPVANVKRDIKAIATTTAIETDNYLMQYRMEKAMLNINYAGNSKNFMDILFNAYRNDREAYELIYDDMLKSGYDTDKIKNGMETRAKEIAGVKKTTDLPKRYMTPAVEEKYDRSLERIKSTDTWTRATVLQKKDAKAGLYEFLTSDSEDMKKTREEAQSYGVDETEYTLWKLAIEMADQPEGEKGSGSYDYTEKAEAINSLDLGDREIAYFFGKGLNESSKEELEQTLDAGIDIQEYVNFKAATSVMEADKNSKDNSIPNSKKRKVVNYLNNSNLTREEWNYFYYEIMGYKK